MVFEWFECPNTWMTVFLCLFNIDWLNNLYKFYWLAIRIQSIKIEWMNEWMKVKVILIWRDIIVVRLQQNRKTYYSFLFSFSIFFILIFFLHPHLLVVLFVGSFLLFLLLFHVKMDFIVLTLDCLCVILSFFCKVEIL